MQVRAVHDPVLGRVDLDALEADLNVRNGAMKSALKDDSIEARAMHFERNGAQVRQSLGRLRDANPERFAALLESCRTRGDFILPEACAIIVEGARLAIKH